MTARGVISAEELAASIVSGVASTLQTQFALLERRMEDLYSNKCKILEWQISEAEQRLKFEISSRNQTDSSFVHSSTSNPRHRQSNARPHPTQPSPREYPNANGDENFWDHVLPVLEHRQRHNFSGPVVIPTRSARRIRRVSEHQSVQSYQRRWGQIVYCKRPPISSMTFDIPSPFEPSAEADAPSTASTAPPTVTAQTVLLIEDNEHTIRDRGDDRALVMHGNGGVPYDEDIESSICAPRGSSSAQPPARTRSSVTSGPVEAPWMQQAGPNRSSTPLRGTVTASAAGGGDRPPSIRKSNSADPRNLRRAVSDVLKDGTSGRASSELIFADSTRRMSEVADDDDDDVPPGELVSKVSRKARQRKQGGRRGGSKSWCGLLGRCCSMMGMWLCGDCCYDTSLVYSGSGGGGGGGGGGGSGGGASVLYRRRDLAPKVPRCFGPNLRSVLYYTFGISDPNVWLGYPGSKIIHPTSPFSSALELTSAGLLIYCVAVVPLQLSFWNNLGSCERVPTLEMDMFVDIFFLLEIAIRFFIGVEDGASYHDHLPTVAWHYLSNPTRFWFDAFTSIPLSWVDWGVLQRCDDSGGGSSGRGGAIGSDGSFIRIIKTLRILKLGRLLKIVKLFSIISERLDISFSRMRIVKLFFVLFSSIHLFACAFWRVKSESLSDDEVNAWLEVRGANLEAMNEKYVTCFYFVCTVFTTVGFGDISATGHYERVFCICMMCCAACVFGLILGELQEIYSAANTKTRELEDKMESVVGFLEEHRVPRHVERHIKNWIRFQYPQQRADAQSQEIMDNLPMALRQVLACIMNRNIFSKVPILSRISNANGLKDNFMAELLVRMSSSFYLAGSVVASHRETADRILVIVSGTVTIYEAGKTGAPEHRLLTIGPGGSIGDNSLLGDERWAGAYGGQADYVASDNCKLCYILAHDFREIVSSSSQYLPIRSMLDKFAYVDEGEAGDEEEDDDDEAAASTLDTSGAGDGPYGAVPAGVEAAAAWRVAAPSRAASGGDSAGGGGNPWGQMFSTSNKSNLVPKFDPIRHTFHWIRFARTLLHTELPPTRSSSQQ